MKSFELESMAEKIHFGKTKDYFDEVVKSYQNECYRSSVVMLWSVVIADLVYKLQSLVDQYGDTKAEAILKTIKKIQDDNPTSSEWEIKLVDEVFKNTDFIESSEYENLRYLQKQRHLSAHPVIRHDLELYRPNKETVRSLIRNSLEGVLTKPPFYTQKVITEFLEDLDESKTALNSFTKLKRYISSRYLDRLSENVEMIIFKTIWAFSFKKSGEKFDENRQINLWVIRAIAERHPTRIISEIKGNRDTYSDIAPNGDPITYFMHYLAYYPEAYVHLSEDAKLKIIHARESTKLGKIYGWFIDGDLTAHFDFLHTWISSEGFSETLDYEWQHLLKISDTDEWEESVSKLIATYYGASWSFDRADSVFSGAILPYLDYLTKESAIFLLEKIENNRQVWDRNRARHDHTKLKVKLDKVLGKDFDYEKFPNFFSNLEE